MSDPKYVDASREAVEKRLQQPEIPCSECGQRETLMITFTWNDAANRHSHTYCPTCAVRDANVFHVILDAILKMPMPKDTKP